MSKPRLFVQVGQRIGIGVVIDPEILLPRGDRRAGATNRGARLLCDCGNEYICLISHLVGKSVPVKSCGCLGGRPRPASTAEDQHAPRDQRPYNFIDRTGRKYGKLTALKLVATRAPTSWLCRCDCGNEAVVSSSSLVTGNTTSCGCVWRVPYLPPGVAARNRVLNNYRRNARNRGLSWELTTEDFDRLTALNCFYCGTPPSATETRASSPFVYSGLDRMDSALGYTLENVVPCCKTCNNAKKDLPYDEWMAWLGRLTAHQWFNPEQLPSRLLKGAA